jgi:predicted NUDIX family NTP pyrophosphohydrolase
MKTSCGILPYRINKEKQLEVFLVHPGGPLWQNKDLNSWSISKGETELYENYLTTAIREFKEECGVFIDDHEQLIYLDSIQQNSNKQVLCWAVYCQNDIKVKSNFIEIEWPSKSKQITMIPEIDKGQFFTMKEAEIKIIKKQYEFILRLYRFLKEDEKL